MGPGWAVDAGLRIAVEYHAGEMHSGNLKLLAEAAEPDFMGVGCDSVAHC